MIRSFFQSFNSSVLCDETITFLKSASQHSTLFITRPNLQELQINEN